MIHLSILVFFPVVCGLLGAFSRAASSASSRRSIPLVYAVMLVADFDTAGGLQHVTDDAWIPELGIRYKLGIDGLNLWLILLTTVVAFACAVWLAVRPRRSAPGLFTFHLALGETAVLGAFVRAGPGAVRPLLRPDAGAVLLPRRPVGRAGPRPGGAEDGHLHAGRLAADARRRGRHGGARAAPGPAARSASCSPTCVRNPLPERTQKWIFITFALAFLIKMPAFPFHGWMPDAYRTMPLPALAFFSGVVSKVAAYGFLRLVLPLFPAATEDFHEILLILAVVSILYGSVQAFTQTNARLILGYSSVAQLGFITLGIFALDAAGQGAQGALLQAVNHGLVVAPLFFVIALLAERAEGSEDIRDYGGIAFRAPVLAVLFLIAALATLAMPGSANFAGEFLILLGVVQLGPGDRDHRVARASCWRRSTRCGCTSARCTTASARAWSPSS